jgi:hypothetical protein
MGWLLSPDTVGAVGGVQLRDVTSEAGISFRHVHGGLATKRYYIETMGAGVAFFDYNGDGYLDLYAVNGQYLSEPERQRATNQLYRNQRDGTFADVTSSTGAGDEGYGMGVVAGDYDNDGDQDLYVTNYGANVLYRNEAGERFSDTGRAAGVGDSRWGVGSAFLDYDNDGDLDLYVANYIDYELADADRELRPYLVPGAEPAPIVGYPHPDNFNGVADLLYRNDGLGSFTDVTKQAGVYNPNGKGMGLACADYDNDGDIDIFVANDQTENFLYRNNADGTLTEVGLPSGMAYDRDGRIQSGMGADFGDYDNDGLLDMILTVYQGESNALYHSEGGGFFSDVAFPADLAVPSLPYVSWGTGFFDYDNDGYRDIFVTNGHVLDNVEQFDSSSRYAQPNQVFQNMGPDPEGHWRFEDVSAAIGIAVSAAYPSRGAAFGDYDNDGDIDLFILNLNEEGSLFRNDGGDRNHWLMIKTIGTHSNRDGIGARVRVEAGELVLTDQVLSGGSYLSHSDVRLSFGLGSREDADRIEIRWPSGTVDVLVDVKADQIITVLEGTGLIHPESAGLVHPESAGLVHPESDSSTQ